MSHEEDKGQHQKATALPVAHGNVHSVADFQEQKWTVDRLVTSKSNQWVSQWMNQSMRGYFQSVRQERESPLDWSRSCGQLLLLSAPTEHMEVSGVESAGTRKWLSMSFWLLPSKIGAEPKRLDLKFNFKEKKNFGPAFRTTFIELKLKKKKKKKRRKNHRWRSSNELVFIFYCNFKPENGEFRW